MQFRKTSPVTSAFIRLDFYTSGNEFKIATAFVISVYLKYLHTFPFEINPVETSQHQQNTIKFNLIKFYS